MPLASTRDSGLSPADTRWWLAAPLLHAAREREAASLCVTACYLIGDALLEVSADDPALLEPFEQLYGECAVATDATQDRPRVRCAVRGAAEPSLLLVRFLEGAPPDPAVAALGLLHPPHGDPSYAVRDARLAGWKLVGGAAPVVATGDTRILIDTQRVPGDFLVEYLVSAALAAQPDLLVLHAGALQVGGAAMLLAGPSRAGKTTTSANLAARGHPLLGDEIALLSLPTREIVPLRRALSLRPGPRAPELAAALARAAIREEYPAGGGKIGPFPIERLFPGPQARAARLEAAFFLSGRADVPALEPFRLTLDDTFIFEYLASNDVAFVSWGLTPARRTLRMLALKRLLARLPCWRLTLGAPSETAQLIERTMEER